MRMLKMMGIILLLFSTKFSTYAETYDFELNDERYLYSIFQDQNAINLIEARNRSLIMAFSGLFVISSLGLIYAVYVQTYSKRKLRHSKNLMNYVIQHNNAAIAVHDTELNYIYVSQNYLEQFDVKEEDVIGRHHYDVFPDLPQKWRDVHQKALQGEVLSADRDPFMREDGQVLWTRWEARPWYDENNDIGGIVVYTEVINKHIEIEQTLQVRLDDVHIKNEELEATLMSIGDGVIITDERGYIVNINTITETMTGVTQEDAKGLLFDDFFNAVNEKTGKKTKNPVKQVLKTNDRVELENHTILIHKDGSERFIEDSAMPIKNKANKLIGVVMVFRDVTQRLELDASLNKEKQRLSKVVESSADIIFEIDKDARYVSVFGKGLNRIGMKSEDFTGRNAYELFGEEATERSEAYHRALEGETVFYEWQFNKNAVIIYFESSVSPIYDIENMVVGAVGITRDVTDKKLKQKEIEHISFHDFLTNLYNRRYFAEALVKLDDERNYPLGVLMIDLNGLKILNDAYGHSVGDIALKKVANVLKNICVKDEVIARIGGDEFALIVPKTSENKLEDLKSLILHRVKKESVQNVQLSLAIGQGIKFNKEDDLGEILKTAENTMYKRKLFEGISARNNSIRAILKTLTTKYKEERVHSERVSRICERIGQALNFSKDDIEELKMAGMFHDIGKISIPDAILDKPGKLTKEEYEIIKSHTENGYQILRAADEYSDLAKDALYHHEWWNGNGYPEGLEGKKIPLFSRIISIADAYEAMTSDRPYRKAIKPEQAIEEILAYSGKQFDPTIVEVFVNQIFKKEELL